MYGYYANTCWLEHANVCKYQLTGTVPHNSMTQEVGWYKDIKYSKVEFIIQETV